MSFLPFAARPRADLKRVLDRYLGLANARAHELQRVHAEQLQRLLRVSPVLLVANVLNAAFTLVAMRGHPAWGLIVAWAALVIAIAGSGLVQAWNRGEWVADAPPAVTERRLDRAGRHALLLGCVWGMLPVLAFPAGSAVQQFFLVCVVTGMFSGGALALATLPLASILYAAPMFAGALASLPLGDVEGALPVQILLGVYCVVIVSISLGHARAFAERSLARVRVEEQNQIISLLLRDYEDTSSDWLWEIDETDALQHVSPRFADVLGLPEEAVVGMSIRTLFAPVVGGDPGEDTTEVNPVLAAIRRREAFHEETLPVRVNGEDRWWCVTGRPIKAPDGRHRGFRGFASDITQARASEERVAYLAGHDALTGLANRSRFTEALDEAAARLHRYGEGYALMLVDLDQFKSINDTRGHPFGDAVLVEVARRLRGVSRATDLVGRLGGDEFAVLQGNAGDAAGVRRMANRILEAFEAPFEHQNVVIRIGVSVGVAVAPMDGHTTTELMHNADLALYRAKDEGRGTARFFEAGMGEQADAARRLESDLREAVAREEFRVHFQPLVDSQASGLTGFEALVRWEHPARGLVAPGEFIAVAERIGLIRVIGEYVIEEACRNAAGWPSDLTVSVNLSPLQLEGPEIVATVRSALDRWNVAPARLELEITEGALMQSADRVTETLMALREMGVRIAMDDFGTGYSSLSNLWRFPFDAIKIDQSFVRALDDDASAREILRTIGTLGSSLSVCITAEGVESAAHVDFLRSIACDQMQGFFFGHPVDAADLGSLLEAHRMRRPPPIALVSSSTGGA